MNLLNKFCWDLVNQTLVYINKFDELGYYEHTDAAGLKAYSEEQLEEFQGTLPSFIINKMGVPVALTLDTDDDCIIKHEHFGELVTCCPETFAFKGMNIRTNILSFLGNLEVVEHSPKYKSNPEISANLMKEAIEYVKKQLQYTNKFPDLPIFYGGNQFINLRYLKEVRGELKFV